MNLDLSTFLEPFIVLFGLIALGALVARLGILDGEGVGQIGAVHDGIGGAEAVLHDGAEFQRDQRIGAAIGVDVDARRLEAVGGKGVVQPEIVEYFPGVRADLQAGAEFGDGGAALKQHDPGARPCQHQSQGQAGNSCSGNMIGAARVGHGPNSGSVEQGGNRVGSAGIEIGVEHVMR